MLKSRKNHISYQARACQGSCGKMEQADSDSDQSKGQDNARNHTAQNQLDKFPGVCPLAARKKNEACCCQKHAD